MCEAPTISSDGDISLYSACLGLSLLTGPQSGLGVEWWHNWGWWWCWTSRKGHRHPGPFPGSVRGLSFSACEVQAAEGGWTVDTACGVQFSQGRPSS